MTDELKFDMNTDASWHQAMKFFGNGYGVSVLKATEDSKSGFAGVYATTATEEEEATYEVAIVCGNDKMWTLVEDVKEFDIPYDGVYAYVNMDEVENIMDKVSNLESIPV